MQRRIPPPIVALITIALMWGVSRALPALDFTIPYVDVIFWITLFLGVLIVTIAGFGFIKAKTTTNPLKPESATALITTGLYRFTRNPMYLGMLLIVIAAAVFLSNVIAFILASLFVIAMNRFQIRAEERALENIFGDAYRDYCKRVRRWL